MGLLPEYEDLKAMFAELLDKEYPKELYDKQFSLYADNILARVDLQYEAFKKEENIPERLFTIYDDQRKQVEELKAKYGEIITIEQLKDLYDKQFSLYVDKIIARIDLQSDAFKKEENIPERLFTIYEEQRKQMMELKDKFGDIVTIEQLKELNASK